MISCVVGIFALPPWPIDAGRKRRQFITPPEGKKNLYQRWPEEFPSPIGITFGQTARLSVLNSGEEGGFIINWRFLDSQGRILAQAAERQLIPPNQMRSFDLNADEVNAMRDRFGRIQILAVVRALGGPDTKNLHTSLEVFDNATGKTTVFVSPALIKGFNPQPDPPGIQQ